MSIIRAMMEAVRTSETSVQFNVTRWRYIPDDSQLHKLVRYKQSEGLAMRPPSSSILSEVLIQHMEHNLIYWQNIII